ncbi:MAG TPA: hypothetical protein VJ323_15450, partial [Bryobacteraceae bacterium]|nr:hypothetical protein [Bryobacteraceae bacterium]
EKNREKGCEETSQKSGQKESSQESCQGTCQKKSQASEKSGQEDSSSTSGICFRSSACCAVYCSDTGGQDCTEPGCRVAFSYGLTALRRVSNRLRSIFVQAKVGPQTFEYWCVCPPASCRKTRPFYQPVNGGAGRPFPKIFLLCSAAKLRRPLVGIA